jgi:hypothetical protein
VNGSTRIPRIGEYIRLPDKDPASPAVFRWFIVRYVVHPIAANKDKKWEEQDHVYVAVEFCPAP